MKTTPTTLKSTGFNPEKAKKKAKKAHTALPPYLNRRKDQQGLQMPSIELYQSESSLSSHAVRNRLSRLGVDYVAHSVPDGNALKHRQLVQAGGKDEVPLLVDHRTGVKLYDASAILTYLDKEYGSLPERRVLRLVKQVESEVRARTDRIAWAIRKPLDKARDLRAELGESARVFWGVWSEVKRAMSRETAV